MKKFKIVLSQYVGKDEKRKERRLEQTFKIKNLDNETIAKKAIEITSLLAKTRKEMYLRGAKFVLPFNLATSFTIGCEANGKLEFFDGSELFGGNQNKMQANVNYSIREQISKGVIVASIEEVFIKRTAKIAESIYYSICDGFGVDHMQTLEGKSKRQLLDSVNNNTIKLLK